jgi:hypothetical protein
MHQKTVTIFAIGALALVAGLAAYFWWPRPATRVTGDAWDYGLHPEDMPAEWTFGGQTVLTAHELSASIGLTPTASLNNAQQLYRQRYEPPTLSQFVEFTLQIVLYNETADAAAGMSAEAPGEGWERLDAPGLGDESRVWGYTSEEASADQTLFRVDFRHLNAIASVTMLGTRQVMPDATEPLSYARKILDKFKAEPEPPELGRLRAAQAPDLRTLLLSQTQIAQLDSHLGERWTTNTLILPGWTNNEDFSTEAARTTLNQLNRITGYQMFLLKSLTATESQTDTVANLFQQVSLYGGPRDAGQGLQAMVGVPDAPELEQAPAAGEAARQWVALLKRTQADGEEFIVAISEIDFRVGRYVASVQVQTRPLREYEQELEKARAARLSLALAQQLAENLQAAER